MKLVIVLAALVCACAGEPLPAYYRAQDYYRHYPGYYPGYYPQYRAGLEGSAAIVRSESEQNENGFHYSFETENGIKAEESGVEANGIQAQGSYSYPGDDGKVYTVRYTAGADGFRPVGDHLPKSPPIPEAIARALEYNARAEARGIIDDGSYNSGKYRDAFGVLKDRTYNNYYNPLFNRYRNNKFYNRNY